MTKANIKKNAMYYNILKTFSSFIFPLLTFLYILRVLQIENVRKINFANSVVSYFYAIVTLGITTDAIRECDKGKLGKISSKIKCCSAWYTTMLDCKRCSGESN